MKRWSTLGQELAKEEDVKEEIEAAKGRKSWLSSRDEYKQKRLDKIMAMKEKEKIKPDAQSMEEI